MIVAPQIAYLPALYEAYSRRETEVTLLTARAGVPPWGPELLARTHYALGPGELGIEALPDLYAQWERWAADVADTHSAYLPLVRFRSSEPQTSWVTALLPVLDSAALFLVLSPASAPGVPARLCLRNGYLCFRRIARAVGFHVDYDPDPGAGISLTYQEFLDGVAHLRQVDFPIPSAWPHFVGWRSTTSRPPTRWPSPSTPGQRCGPDPPSPRRRHPAVPPPLARPPS